MGQLLDLPSYKPTSTHTRSPSLKIKALSEAETCDELWNAIGSLLDATPTERQNDLTRP